MIHVIRFHGFQWVDLLLPLSLLGLLWERSGNPDGMVLLLFAWCFIKFWRQSLKQPLYVVLIGILATILSAVIDPVSISEPADLILVLLAFAAGLRQTSGQWRISIWILLFTVLLSIPLLDLSRFNGNLDIIPWQSVRDVFPQEAVRIRQITINRSGYLFGIFSILAYGLCRSEKRYVASLVAAVVCIASYLLAFGTGSRAAFCFPLVAIFAGELLWKNRFLAAKYSRSLAVVVMSLALAFNLALYLPFSVFTTGDASDKGRAEVAQCFVGKAFEGFPVLLTGQGYDRVSQYCASKVFLPGAKKGIPHAHNLFIQVLSDYGLISFLLLILAFGLVLNRFFLGLSNESGLLCMTGLACALFILASSLVESTLLKTSLQQVVTGYLFSIPWFTAQPSSSGSCFD